MNTALVISIAQSSVYADSLLYAINSSNVNQVKSLLAHGDYLDSSYQKTLLNVAKEASFMAKHNLKFFRSEWDIAKVWLGLFLILTIEPTKATVSKNKSALEEFLQKPVIRLAQGIAGLTSVYKGVTLSSAYAKERAAREIQLLIENKFLHEQQELI
ncbi:hypothetical protein H0X48_04755 [Candidatus Dependentiae bacterium]|nr:hypothetical protein [Candidatus Dependentiae bacterium]